MQRLIKATAKVTPLLLALLALFAFAHFFVLQTLNQHNQQRQQNLAAGNYHLSWDFTKPDDLLVLFEGKRLEPTSSGLSLWGKQAAFSLNLHNQSIDLNVHKQLQLDLQTNAPQATLLIELADAKYQQFYSTTTTIKSGQQQIDLSQQQWRHQQQFIKWSQIERANSLVLRFYAQQPSNWQINAINLPQQQPKTWPPIQAINCSELESYSPPNAYLVSGCIINNTMKVDQQTLITEDHRYHLQWNSPITINSFWWLLFSYLSLLLFIAINHRQKPNQTFLLVTVSYALTVILHQPITAKIINYPALSIIALLLIIRLLFHYRQAWRVQSHAPHLWLLFIALACYLWAFSGFDLQFIKKLPQYLLWAWLQQIIIALILLTNLRRYHSDRTAILLTATLFCLLHSPNHLLMLATFIAAICWSWIWIKYRNLPLMVTSHATLALLLYQAAGESVFHSARIGIWF